VSLNISRHFPSFTVFLHLEFPSSFFVNRGAAVESNMRNASSFTQPVTGLAQRKVDARQAVFDVRMVHELLLWATPSPYFLRSNHH